MKYFIQLKNGEPFGHIITEDSLQYINSEFKNSLVEVIRGEPPQETLTHVLTHEQSYYINPDGLVVETWSTRPRNIDERAKISPSGEYSGHAIYIDGVRALRAERNLKLVASDWTQFSDVQLSDEQRRIWSDYRQDLRDIPQQPGFPWTVTWPTPPSA